MTETPRQEISDTFWVRIYMSGPIDVAKQAIRAECLRAGLCVTIVPTSFIYTGGEESGFIVELVNYPKFPQSEIDILNRATALAMLLLDATHQESVLLMTPTRIGWVSFRRENQK